MLGAALVEYAVILSLFALAFIPLLDDVEDRTSDEVNNEFDCVSQRPPPTSCQRRAVVVTTTTAPTTTIADTTTTESTTTTEPTTTTSSTTTTVAPTTSTTAGIGSSSANWTFIRRGNYDGTEYVAAVFYLYDSSGNPVPGRTVSLSLRGTDGSEVATGQCETASGDYAGRCFGIYRLPDWADAVHLAATAVSGTPQLTAPPEPSPTVG